MVIMDLWGMAFHAMVVIGLIPTLLFISTWACCGSESIQYVHAQHQQENEVRSKPT